MTSPQLVRSVTHREERPVANPKLMGRPVDEKAEEPTSGETPVDDETYEPMPENRPVADPRLAIRPVNVMAYEPMPWDVPVWCGPCGVSCRRSRQTIGYAKGSASGQVYDSDGPVAPSVWSGSSRAVTNVDLHFLYKLRVLFWQKRAIDSVTIWTL